MPCFGRNAIKEKVVILSARVVCTFVQKCGRFPWKLVFCHQEKMSGACKHGKFCGLYTRRTPLVDRWFSIGEKPKKVEKIEKIGKKITNLY